MLSVVIPCLNESENVRRFPAELYPLLPADSEVILVDDGSDEPLADPKARVIRHERNLGLGAALRTGFSEAKGDWILTLDADLTFSPKDIVRLLDKSGEAELVGGSPWLPGGGFTDVPLSRRLPSALINAFFRGFITPALTSYTSIFRLYRASTLRSFELVSRGYEINAELAARFVRAGRKTAEVPARLSARRHGHSKLSGARELRNHAALAFTLLKEAASRSK